MPDPGTVEIEKDGGVWLVTLRGEHDRFTAPGLRDALESIFALGAGPAMQRTRIVVDLTAVDFMDSSVIGALAVGRGIAQRDPRAALAIATRSPADRVLTLSGTARVIPTYASREAAVRAHPARRCADDRDVGAGLSARERRSARWCPDRGPS